MYQFGGLNAVFVFSNKIFALGITDPNSNLPNTLSVILGVINNCMTVVALKLNDTFGRKRLLLIGITLMGILWLSYAITGFILTPSNIICKILIVCYPLPFGMSAGAVTFLYLGETLPDVGMALASMLIWIMSFVVA